MKKALFFAAAALFVAGMTVSCGNKNAEEVVEDSVIEEVVEEPTEEAIVEEAPVAETEVDNTAMLAAAKEAGQAKCNCYKKDPAAVESCIRAILSESYAAYQNDESFKSAMNAEYQSCVKAKVQAAAKEQGDKAIKAGAEALSNKLNKKN